MTGQDTFTDRAADVAGSLDLLLTDAALGPLRRMLPGLAGARFGARLAGRPRTLAVRGTDLLREYARIAAGQSALAPAKGDRRFADPAWTGNPLLRRLVQAYLASARTAENLVTDADLPWRDEERMRFVLSTAGHIASLVNPPDNPKSTFRTAAENPADADAWLGNATTAKGSWWPDYSQWLAERSGPLITSPATLGSADCPPREPAPGTYVFDR